jgi:penicillin-binding protein 2
MAYGEADPGVGGRARILFWAVAAVAFLYSLVLWNLQIVRSEEFRGQSERNAVRNQPVRAGRGLILESRSRIIAGNRRSFDVLVDREEISPEEKRAAIDTLSDLLFLDEASIVERLAEGPSHKPALVAEDVAFSQVARIEAHRHEHPRIRIRPTHRREYPFGPMASHLLGYIGEISQSELDRPGLANHRAGDLVGKAGIERYYDRYLTGTDGTRLVVVDARGQEVDSRIAGDPVVGSTLTLTLDLDVQTALDEAMADKAGAAVVLDPDSGAVLALTSKPSFDPNLFSRRLSRETWKSINRQGENPLHNRAVQSRFSPGSTFKILMTIAALEERVITPDTSFHCNGGATLHGQWRRCWKPGGHGTVNLHEAIRGSCNAYFYRVGDLLGIERIARWARAFGYGAVSGLDVPGESAGTVPDPAWKRATLGEAWWPGETVSVAIGQGALEVTPLQQAVFAAAVANGGGVYRPFLVREVEDAARPERSMSAGATLVRQVSLRAPTLEVVRRGMWAVVHEQGGTARRARVEERDVCGKTGTAQVHRGSAGVDNEEMEYELRDHAWFVGFAPLENPELAFAVFIEHGGHGGDTAAPVARAVVEAWFDRPVAIQALLGEGGGP